MTWETPKTDWATDDAIGTTDLNRIEGNINLQIRHQEGANGRMGIFTASGGDTEVHNSSITADTRIFLTVQSGTTVSPAICNVKSRSVGHSFIVLCDTVSVVIAYLLIEPE